MQATSLACGEAWWGSIAWHGAWSMYACGAPAHVGVWGMIAECVWRPCTGCCVWGMITIPTPCNCTCLCGGTIAAYTLRHAQVVVCGGRSLNACGAPVQVGVFGAWSLNECGTPAQVRVFGAWSLSPRRATAHVCVGAWFLPARYALHRWLCVGADSWMHVVPLRVGVWGLINVCMRTPALTLVFLRTYYSYHGMTKHHNTIIKARLQHATVEINGWGYTSGLANLFNFERQYFVVSNHKRFVMVIINY